MVSVIGSEQTAAATETSSSSSCVEGESSVDSNIPEAVSESQDVSPDDAVDSKVAESDGVEAEPDGALSGSAMDVGEIFVAGLRHGCW